MQYIKTLTIGKVIAALPVVIVFVFIVVSVVKVVVFRDYSGCWYRFQIIERSIVGRIATIDTVHDRSGVGFYIKNEQEKETFGVYSDTLLSMYRNGDVNIGDMILKYPQTKYGYIVGRDGRIYYVSLLNDRKLCDTMSARSRDSIVRKFPVDFSE